MAASLSSSSNKISKNVRPKQLAEPPLIKFLESHVCSSSKDATHTRMPGGSCTAIKNASWIIPPADLPQFYDLYRSFIQAGYEGNFTERQNLENGPIMIDIDLHYSMKVQVGSRVGTVIKTNVEKNAETSYEVQFDDTIQTGVLESQTKIVDIERFHTEAHVTDLIQLYLTELKSLLKVEDLAGIGNNAIPQIFPIYVFERKEPRIDHRGYIADGIHIIIGIQMCGTLKNVLRTRVMEHYAELQLPTINEVDKIFDEGIACGKTLWPLFGSNKPKCKPYDLTHAYDVSYDGTGEFEIEPLDFDANYAWSIFDKLSAQYSNYIRVEPTQEALELLKPKTRRAVTPARQRVESAAAKEDYTEPTSKRTEITIRPDEITTHEHLNILLDDFFGRLQYHEHHLKEVHEYTMILPEKYYEPGSHLLNRCVAFALKNTDNRLFLTWVALRAKASDFDFGTISELYAKWDGYFNKSDDEGKQLTKRSIYYWAEHDAPEEYRKLREQSRDNLVEQSIYSQTDYDYALVLNHMYKGEYACIDKRAKEWVRYKKHYWAPDRGVSIRLKISKEMYSLYAAKHDEAVRQLRDLDMDDEGSADKNKKITKRIDTILGSMRALKQTKNKENIMKEVTDLFYDDDFLSSMDENPYLLCFKNGVVDYKEKKFRNGSPLDYITKCMDCEYLGDDPSVLDPEKVRDINEYLKRMYPSSDELYRYVWDMLAACLIGKKKRESIELFRGIGSNGKTLLMTFLALCLGTYFDKLNINVLTSDRPKMGCASPDLLKLRATRLVISEEATKTMTLNVGIMKEITGGGSLDVRALFKANETIKLQCSLIICINEFFKINSTDEGSWRRIKVVPHLARFLHPNDSRRNVGDKRYIFDRDDSIADKFKKWADTFSTMLVHRGYQTEGVVYDSPEVISASLEYEKSQDMISLFIAEKFVINPHADMSDLVGTRALGESFKDWCQQNNYSTREIPKMSEVREKMTEKFGPQNSCGKWNGVTFRVEHNASSDAIALRESTTTSL